MDRLEELSVLLTLHVDVNKNGSYEELHDHVLGDNWAHTKLNNGNLVGGKDDSEPIKRIITLLLDHAVKWNLTADQFYKKCPCSPHH